MKKLNDQYNFEFDAPAFSNFLPNKELSYFYPCEIKLNPDSVLDQWFLADHPNHYFDETKMFRKNKFMEVEVKNIFQGRFKGEQRPLVRKRKQISTDEVQKRLDSSKSEYIPIKRQNKQSMLFIQKGKADFPLVVKAQNNSSNRNGEKPQKLNELTNLQDTCLFELTNLKISSKSKSQSPKISSQQQRHSSHTPKEEFKDKKSVKEIMNFKGRKQNNEEKSRRLSGLLNELNKDRNPPKEQQQLQSIQLVAVKRAKSVPVGTQRFDYQQFDKEQKQKNSQQSFPLLGEQEKKRNQSLNLNQKSNISKQLNKYSGPIESVPEELLISNKVNLFEKEWEKQNGIKLYMLNYKQRKEIRTLYQGNNS